MIMSFHSRGSLLAVLGFGLMVVAGCQQDNEAAVRAQQSTGTTVAPQSQAQTQAEAYKEQQQRNTFSKASGYPGAKK